MHRTLEAEDLRGQPRRARRLADAALDVGKVFLVAGAISIVLMPIIGKNAHRVDPRALLLVGVGIVTGSQMIASHLTPAACFWDLVTPNMVRSAGLGFILIPVSLIALSDIPADKRGNATGLFNLTRELGGSIGTAVMGMLVTDGIKVNGSYLSESITPQNQLVEEQAAQMTGMVGTMTFQKELVAESLFKLKVTTQAMVLSFEHGFRVVASVIRLGLLLVLVMTMTKSKSTGPIDGVH